MNYFSLSGEKTGFGNELSVCAKTRFRFWDGNET